MNIPRFHLAFPVIDLESTRKFYSEVLGCTLGRESNKWIDLMTEPSENNEAYGYMWGLNKGYRKWEGLAENIFYGAGFGGNYVVIVPDHQLVIVARWIDSSKIGDLVKRVVDAHKK